MRILVRAAHNVGARTQASTCPPSGLTQGDTFRLILAGKRMHPDLQKILVTPEAIEQRVRDLGKEITSLYAPTEELTLIAIINGAVLFTADLMRRIHRPLLMDCMRVSSYEDATSPQKQPEVIDMLRLELKDRHVIIIDDILDTGHTMAHVRDQILQLKPASLRFCVLLEKSGRREVTLEPDLVGFSIPDEFVVGYGLDFAERYRELPCIGVLKPECQNPPIWR